MTPAEFAREFTYPLRNSTTLVTIIVLALLLVLADAAGLLGLWLYAIVLLCAFRYNMVLLEARARGVAPPTPDLELFSFVGNLWSLFPVVHLAIGYGLVRLGDEAFGSPGAFVLGVAFVLVLPAFLAALAVTRSPVESLNPGTAFRLIARIGQAYWAAPGALLLGVTLPAVLPELPRAAALILNLAVGFGVVAVIGAMIRPFDFFAEVDIETPAEPEASTVERKLAADRTAVLNHAYGLASRGNVDGALRHIAGWVDRDDPYPGDAWPWFFDAMLRWEDRYPALKLGQDYLDLLLKAGETHAAAKLMLRCKFMDDSFRPHAESHEAAVAAAETVGQADLVEWLRRR